MKIAYIVSELNKATGLEKMVLLQTDYFIKNFKYEIEIISINQESEDLKSLFKVNSKIKLHYLNINKSSCKNLLLRIKSINIKLEEIGPHIVMVCINEIFGLYLASLVKKKCPFIYQRHGSINLNLVKSNKTKHHKLIDAIKKVIISNAGHRFDRFVLLSEQHKNDWVKLKNTIVINNPISLDIFENQANLDKNIVLAVGRQDFVKGYDMLIKAWQKVVKDYPEWVLKIYGKPNESLGLEKMAFDLRIQNAIQFKAHTNDIKSVYLKASFLVCSSRTEGFPLVIIEAMSLGLPVVSFDCPYGPSAIISDKKDGILVEANNIDKLSDAIKLLISNVNLRKSMGIAAKKNVERFSKDKIMQKWKSLLEDVLID